MHVTIDMHRFRVAPVTGAWIETIQPSIRSLSDQVAPVTGAWIETSEGVRAGKAADVAPVTGAWIETPTKRREASTSPSRARHGRVD